MLHTRWFGHGHVLRNQRLDPSPYPELAYWIVTPTSFNDLAEITGTYEYPVPPPAPAPFGVAASPDPSPVAELQIPPVVALGSNLTALLVLSNRAQNDVAFEISWALGLIEYDGAPLTNVLMLARETHPLHPHEERSLTRTVTESDYLQWLNISCNLEFRALVTEVSSSDSTLAFGRTTLRPPVISVAFTPTNQIARSNQILCTASWSNNLSLTLTNVLFQLQSTEGLSLAGTNLLAFAAVPPGTTLSVSNLVTGLRDGSEFIRAVVRSDSLPLIEGVARLEVGYGPTPAVRRLAEGLELSFSAAAGDIYRLEYSDRLHAEQWSLLGEEVTGAGQPVTVIDRSLTSFQQRFDRVRLFGQ